MMKNFTTLVGLSVRVFVEDKVIDGTLDYLDDEKIIINSEGAYLLIYKHKISMVLLNPLELETSEPPIETTSNQNKQEEILEERFAQNGIAENNQYGTILPVTLLTQQPEDPIERILKGDFLEEIDENFSINARTLYDEEGLLNRAERQRILASNKKDGDGSK